MIFLILTYFNCIIGSRFIHLIRTDSYVSFLWQSNIPLCIYTIYISFIHSSVSEHLDCFHVLAIVNSTAVNNGIHVSFSIFVSSGYMLGVELLGHMMVLFLVF